MMKKSNTDTKETQNLHAELNRRKDATMRAIAEIRTNVKMKTAEMKTAEMKTAAMKTAAMKTTAMKTIAMKTITKKTIVKKMTFRDETNFIDFSFDSLLAMSDSKKIKDKNRSSESQNKQKRQNKDTFITRDSSDFEFAERKFNQRVNSIDEHERERKERRERSREEDDRERDDRERSDRKRDDRKRNDRKRDDRDRERDQIIDETTDVDEVSSEMISLLQF
jgi:hypothetical protein